MRSSVADSWEYRVLWEYAGLTPPDLHEDELQSIIDTLNAITDGIFSGADAVTRELGAVQSSGISSTAFDALYDRWHQRGSAALIGLADTLGSLQEALGRALVDIYEFKSHLVAAVGLADMGLTIEYVASGGIAALGSHLGIGVGKAEIRRKLENLLDDVEGKLVRLVIDGTPLSDLQTRVAQELQKIIDETIDDSGQAVGQFVVGIS
jgi:hypothetical protein